MSGGGEFQTAGNTCLETHSDILMWIYVLRLASVWHDCVSLINKK